MIDKISKKQQKSYRKRRNRELELKKLRALQKTDYKNDRHEEILKLASKIL